MVWYNIHRSQLRPYETPPRLRIMRVNKRWEGLGEREEEEEEKERDKSLNNMEQ